MKKITILALCALISTLLLASNKTLIQQGKYLAQAADCYACHTKDIGKQFGGGVPFPTPFGIIYSKNISSSKKYGIGSYTYNQFVKAVRKGVTPHGNLYPAMPFVSFRLIKDKDMKALYAYFVSIKAVNQANKKDGLKFPFNIRVGMKAWNIVNYKAIHLSDNYNKSKAYKRGNYLVNSLGHCGACHTPRNFTMGIKDKFHLQGNLIAGVFAPNITPQSLQAQGWGKSDITNILKYGYSRKGTVLGHMTPITYHSLSMVNNKDLNAIATYLLGDKNNTKKPLVFNGHDKTKSGYVLYIGYCSSCHGINGQGIKNVAPALAGDGTLERKRPLNTIYTLVYGIGKTRYSQNDSFGTMPKFKLNPQELTDLVNYLQATFTPLKISHSQGEIMKMKKEVIKGHNAAKE